MQLTTFAAATSDGPHISLAAEKLFSLGPIAVTNALLTGMIGSLMTIALLFYVASKLKKGERNFFVGLVQWAFEGFYGQAQEIIGDKVVARKVFPLAITMFFIVVLGYWISVLPGVGSITYNAIPVVRAVPADLNFTFALAIITVVASQVYAIQKHGFFGNVGRYLRNPIKDPVGAFEGILEFVGEFSRLVALSFRLFGNAFAGEVLLILIALLSGYFAAIVLPFFIIFEVFIGFIQAYVFFVLTLIFTSLALATHGHDDSHAHSPSATANPAPGNDTI